MDVSASFGSSERRSGRFPSSTFLEFGWRYEIKLEHNSECCVKAEVLDLHETAFEAMARMTLATEVTVEIVYFQSNHVYFQSNQIETIA